MPSTLQSVPVLLEVLAHIRTDFFHCLRCERVFGVADIGAAVRRETRTTYPPEMRKDAERLATWLGDLSTRYGEQLHIRVVDPQSMERRYPTFVINRRTKYAGWEPAALNCLLAKQIANGGGG
jgi:hypothetical protein